MHCYNNFHYIHQLFTALEEVYLLPLTCVGHYRRRLKFPQCEHYIDMVRSRSESLNSMLLSSRTTLCSARCYEFHTATPCISHAQGLCNTDHDQPTGYSDMKTVLVCVQLISIKVSTMKLQPKETEVFLGSDSDTKRMKDGKNKNHDCTCPQFSSSSNFQWTWLWGLYQTGKISAVQIYASHRKNTSVAPNINTIQH